MNNLDEAEGKPKRLCGKDQKGRMGCFNNATLGKKKLRFHDFSWDCFVSHSWKYPAVGVQGPGLLLLSCSCEVWGTRAGSVPSVFLSCSPCGCSLDARLWSLRAVILSWEGSTSPRHKTRELQVCLKERLSELRTRGRPLVENAAP